MNLFGALTESWIVLERWNLRPPSLFNGLSCVTQMGYFTLLSNHLSSLLKTVHYCPQISVFLFTTCKWTTRSCHNSWLSCVVSWVFVFFSFPHSKVEYLLLDDLPPPCVAVNVALFTCSFLLFSHKHTDGALPLFCSSQTLKKKSQLIYEVRCSQSFMEPSFVTCSACRSK